MTNVPLSLEKLLSKESRRARIIGEIVGALEFCQIVLKEEDINKKGLQDILDRYHKEFD